jgi:hypothetical protein
MKKIKVAIVGYGNVGKMALEAIQEAPDMELIGVVRRASSLKGSMPEELKNTQVVSSIKELDRVDVAILCSPSRLVPQVTKELLTVGINTVDSYDIHSGIWDLKQVLDPVAKQHNAVAVVSAGWDPGSDSIVRALFQALAPKGITYTNFVNVDGQGYGIAVLNEGLYEYEHLRDSENTIALTLLRGNGFISSDETGLPMEDRWLVPDNQCLGVHTLNISIYPHKGNYLEGEVPQKAQDFLNPLLVYCQPVDTRKFTGGRPFVQDSDVAEIFFRDKKYPDIKLPRSLQVVSIKGKDVVLSCVKQKEKGDSLILRLFNPSSASSSFSITLFQPYHKAFMVNLNEEKQQEVRLTDQRTINLLMAPKEIITLELVPFSRG